MPNISYDRWYSCADTRHYLGTNRQDLCSLAVCVTGHGTAKVRDVEALLCKSSVEIYNTGTVRIEEWLMELRPLSWP